MILIINTGSSSIKCSLFEGKDEIKHGVIDKIGKEFGVINYSHAWEKLYQGISSHHDEIEAVGHRIVHGGDKYREISRINQGVIDDLKGYSRLAPMHMPQVLEVVETTMDVFADVPQFGIFDTSFFSGLPDKVKKYPISYEISDSMGFKKYGFHGISHKYATRMVQDELGLIRTQRLVTVHLGAGSSVAAVKEGKCVDTSMGFTPLEGLMMATRAGDLDSGILLYLLKEGWDVDKIEELVSKKSGWLGVSGISDDMRDLLYLAGFKVEDDDYKLPKDLPKDEVSIGRARLAIEMFVYRVVKYIGAYTAVLGGLDALVFTGSIGAGSSEIRDLIMNNFEYLDNFEMLVVEPNEEEEMRREVETYLKKGV